MLLKNLGKYEIIDWLGGGRFGDVFLARDTLLDKSFALKISRMKKEEIAMLKDEAKLLASLNHPHIVRFYNIDFIENRMVLVMEYIAGTTLRDVIQEGGIDVPRAASIMLQVIDAVHYAHASNVLHRDLKPENILLTEHEGKEFAKVTDFGLAKFMTGSISASTAGTPLYMAPEVWAGDFTEKSDVWSIGALFYELLTGTPPFLSDNLNALREKIEKGTFLVPTMVRPHIPDYIEDAVIECLRVKPQSRPTTAELREQVAKHDRAIKAGTGFAVPKKHIVVSLTADQKDVIAAVDGTVLLVGQAGCGKTTTLTYAIARLVERGIPASRILVCTFTTKAANDIRERLQRLVTIPLYDLWIGTFHTLGLRILRRDIERLDMSDDFSIKAPQEIFAEMGITTGKYRANAVMKLIGILKAQGITVDAFKPRSEWETYCCEIYEKYQTYARERNILDYDDLILYALHLLDCHDDIREYYKNLFEYIFVDELQDINRAQYTLISRVYNRHIFFTGDEDQSIYGWRGAEPDLIYRVPKDYKETRTFSFTKSFRLPQDILEIANNIMLRKPTAIPTTGTGDILVYAAKSEKDEADYIVNEIQNIRKEQYRFQDIAVLYRMNYISRMYEEAFIKAHIPHALIGGTSFYERADIKSVLQYLELLERYAGPARKTKTQVEEFLAKSSALFKLKKKTIERAQQVFEHHLHNATQLSPFQLINDVINAANLVGENLDELRSLAQSYRADRGASFLNEIRLIQELDLADWGKDTVKLMTIHCAKGLEFPVVFVVDLAEDIFPLTKKMASRKELDEERRLCYVAITRAQKKLYLLYPKWRSGRHQNPSRFLIDMFKTMPQP